MWKIALPLVGLIMWFLVRRALKHECKQKGWEWGTRADDLASGVIAFVLALLLAYGFQGVDKLF